MGSAGEVIVRPLTEADLPEADRICQLAFGTYLGAAERRRPRSAQSQLVQAQYTVCWSAPVQSFPPVQRLAAHPQASGPGAFSLSISAGGSELLVRLDRQGARVASVTL